MARAAPLAFVALVFAAPAAAQRSDPCARLEEPIAYNACLAAHGPRAAATRPATPNEEAAGAVRRAPRGRQRLEFNLGD
jgi:hypothetical protein